MFELYIDERVGHMDEKSIAYFKIWLVTNLGIDLNTRRKKFIQDFSFTIIFLLKK